MLNVLVKRLSTDAKLPIKGSPEAACFDLHVASWTTDIHGYVVYTGSAIAMPPGYGMLVFPRSGISTAYGLSLRNGTGVIDSDYRGEIILKLNKCYTESLKTVEEEILQPGSRIAQAMIIWLPDIKLIEVDDLPSSFRGTGGFGSTG